MALSRKNYEAVARILKTERNSIPETFPEDIDADIRAALATQINYLAAKFAAYFAADNSRFDREGFMEASR